MLCLFTCINKMFLIALLITWITWLYLIIFIYCRKFRGKVFYQKKVSELVSIRFCFDNFYYIKARILCLINNNIRYFFVLSDVINLINFIIDNLSIWLLDYYTFDVFSLFLWLNVLKLYLIFIFHFLDVLEEILIYISVCYFKSYVYWDNA